VNRQDVNFEDGIVLPLRMRRCGGLHVVEHKEDLEIQRLLGPERAVFVEDCDAILRCYEVRATAPSLLS
jgi:hypothetical protein